MTRGYATMAQCTQYLRQVLRERNLSSLPPDHAIYSDRGLQFLQRRFHFCKGTSLFATSDDEIGLGSKDMREGDVLTILLGCDNAIVLQPCEDDQDGYRVIGNAFATHIMDAEPLLGQLPLDFESVRVLKEPNGYYLPAFRNKTDGSITYQDPPLPPLSPEWETLSGSSLTEPFNIDSPLAYRNDLTQEVLDYLRDPRMTANALKERGIDIETFKLV